MKWACLIIAVLIMLSFSQYVFAEAINPTNNPNPSLTQQQAAVAGVSVSDLTAIFSKFGTDVMANDDANMQALDLRIKGYMQDTQTRAIIGVFGLNLLIAGGVFYFVNKQTRRLSYESFAIRRRESEEDRNYFIETINIIRQRLDFLEEESKKKYDVSLLPMETLDAEMRRRYQFYQDSQMQQFDQQLNQFVNPQQYGGAQNEWATTGSQITEAAPYDAVANSYGAQASATSSATPEYGGAQAQRRIDETRFV
jgi:hypothetical protein